MALVKYNDFSLTEERSERYLCRNENMLTFLKTEPKGNMKVENKIWPKIDSWGTPHAVSWWGNRFPEAHIKSPVRHVRPGQVQCTAFDTTELQPGNQNPVVSCVKAIGSKIKITAESSK